jgi:hypothetical protein
MIDLIGLELDWVIEMDLSGEIRLISADGWPSHPFLTTMKSECQIV